MFGSVYRRAILTTTVRYRKNVHEKLKLNITFLLNLTVFDLVFFSNVSSASIRRSQIWTGSDFAASTTVSPYLDSESCVESALGFFSINGLTSKNSKSARYCPSTIAISLLMLPKNYSLQTTDWLISSTKFLSVEFTKSVLSNRDSWNSTAVVLAILANTIFFDILLLFVSWLHRLSQKIVSAAAVEVHFFSCIRNLQYRRLSYPERVFTCNYFTDLANRLYQIHPRCVS